MLPPSGQGLYSCTVILGTNWILVDQWSVAWSPALKRTTKFSLVTFKYCVFKIVLQPSCFLCHAFLCRKTTVVHYILWSFFKMRYVSLPYTLWKPTLWKQSSLLAALYSSIRSLHGFYLCCIAIYVFRQQCIYVNLSYSLRLSLCTQRENFKMLFLMVGKSLVESTGQRKSGSGPSKQYHIMEE